MQALVRQALRASFAVTSVIAIAASLTLAAGPASASEKTFKFGMVRSAALNSFPNCAANAKGTVKIVSNGVTETMTVSVDNLPPNTDFDLFVIQQPGAPFGMSWYQSDLETDQWGHGSVKVVGRFSDETFIVAPGSVAAPVIFEGDGSSNPATAPIHTYHLGLWFNSATDAGNNGCPNTVTPFNGEHTAGVQLLNTSNFPDLQGPLLSVKN
jgi:hypothetical protein